MAVRSHAKPAPDLLPRRPRLRVIESRRQAKASPAYVSRWKRVVLDAVSGDLGDGGPLVLVADPPVRRLGGRALRASLAGVSPSQ